MLSSSSLGFLLTGQGDGEEAGDDGFEQPLREGGGEEGVGGGEGRGVGLEAAVREVAPLGERDGVDLVGVFGRWLDSF